MIACIIGLANPGATYAKTRHNAGEWFIRALASVYDIQLRDERKLCVKVGVIRQVSVLCRLVVPMTYMNDSGRAVAHMIRFYKLDPEQILVVHDDIDLELGVAKLKFGGGSGGHNGLRSIISTISSASFYRLRIGIGHPGHRNDVVRYVLNRPHRCERQMIDHVISEAIAVMPVIWSGHWQKAVQQLHEVH